MGDDNTIVDAARVSFFGYASQHTDAQNRHLLRYLMRGRHTTPFEMCSITFRVRVPMDTWRQWIRHRTASVNEYSTRYAPAIDSAQTAEGEWRQQAKDNKQGSSGLVAEWPEHKAEEYDSDCHKSPGEYLTAREKELQDLARKVYEERLKFGVAREQARKDLPLSTYTEAYWKMDLHNLFHFLSLRLDTHAQWEIRQYAQAIAEIVKVWVPWAWEAFEDYRLEAMYLTKHDVIAVQNLLQGLRDFYDGPECEDLNAEILATAMKAAGVKGREKKELAAKLSMLLDC